MFKFVQHSKQEYLKFIFIILSAFFLQACTDVAITGAQAIYNRRAWQKDLTDDYITMRAYKRIHIDDDRFKDANIDIATFNSEVLLAGQAPYFWQRKQAEDIVKNIPEVKHVYNLIAISNPSSALKRVSDAWITAKVKARLIASADVDATQVKVVTENGIVYLMGNLIPSEADAAVDLASRTAGVESVVKVFSYIHINKNYDA